MKETKFKQTLVQTKEGSRHCEEHSDVAIQGGFKMTEVGLIPNDWKVKTFCELFEVLPNNTLSRAELNKEYGSYKNVHYGDILVEFGEWIDCSNVGLPFINSNAKFNHTVLQDGDIVIADTAEDETVGKSTEITNAKNKKIVSGLHTIPIRPKIKFAPKWLGYYINSACWHDQILPFITGTKVSAISKAAVSQTKLFFPAKIEEQQRIANALSDVDTLIANLEKLIAKKKNIKQGTMQQLLTGKKRLPGFAKSNNTKMTEVGEIPEDWEVKNLGSITQNCSYGVGAEAVSFNGRTKYIRITDIDDDSHRFIPSPLTSPSFYENKHVVQENDLLIARTGASVGKTYLYDSKDGKLIFAGFLIKMNVCEANSKFVFYSTLTKYYQDWIVSESARTGRPGVNLQQMKKLQIALPPTIEEQTAIANVLSDMDTEISALETKLAKYRKLKTGMMQQLLTGKIRLV